MVHCLSKFTPPNVVPPNKYKSEPDAINPAELLGVGIELDIRSLKDVHAKLTGSKQNRSLKSCPDSTYKMSRISSKKKFKVDMTCIYLMSVLTSE